MELILRTAKRLQRYGEEIVQTTNTTRNMLEVAPKDEVAGKIHRVTPVRVQVSPLALYILLRKHLLNFPYIFLNSTQYIINKSRRNTFDSVDYLCYL